MSAYELLRTELSRSERDSAAPAAPLDGAPTASQLERAAEWLAEAVEQLRIATNGTRNDTLNAAAYRLHRLAAGGVLDPDEADDRMRAAALEAGLEPDEVEATLRSARDAGEANPDRPRDDMDLTAISDEQLDALAGQVFGATPVMRHIRDAAHARILSAWSLLAAVLLHVMARVPVGVSLPPIIGSRGSLNFLVALVGGSGGGKTQSLSLGREVLDSPDDAPLEISSPSGEGLVSSFLEWVKDPVTKLGAWVLKPYPHVVLVEDEVGSWEAINARAGSSLLAMVRKALTGDSLTTTNAERERNRKVPAHEYRLAGAIGVQPEKSGVLLDDADAGTPQRIVWLPTTDRTIPDEDVPFPGPLVWSMPAFELDYLVGVPAQVADGLREQHRHRVRGDVTGGLDGHAGLTRLKIAAALAFLHGETDISMQWWDLAGAVLQVSDATRATCAAALRIKADAVTASAGRRDAVRDAARVATKADELNRCADLVRRAVERHTDPEAPASERSHEADAGCTRRCLSHALRHHKGVQLDEVLTRAEAIGHIIAADGRWTLTEEN